MRLDAIKSFANQTRDLCFIVAFHVQSPRNYDPGLEFGTMGGKLEQVPIVVLGAKRRPRPTRKFNLCYLRNCSLAITSNDKANK